MTHNASHPHGYRRQAGATAVEFALVLMAFILLVFGIVEFGRLFYVANSVQEVTRRAAREQVVAWVSARNDIRQSAVFATGPAGALPAGHEVNATTIRITFHATLTGALAGPAGSIEDAGGNADEYARSCLVNDTDCIHFIRASLEGADGTPINYQPLIPLFSFLNIPLPRSTVVMPAEALGLQ